MRSALNLLSLVLASGLAAQTLPGVQARGTVIVTTVQGRLRGAITVEAATAAGGGSACRISIALVLPGGTRTITEVRNGKRTHMVAPAGVAAAALLPLSPRLGCALIAPHAARGFTLTAQPGTARATTLSWTRQTAGGSHTLQLIYSYGALGAYPSQVTETVDGATRLVASFDKAGPHSFAASEFALPPPPPLGRSRSGQGAPTNGRRGGRSPRQRQAVPARAGASAGGGQ